MEIAPSYHWARQAWMKPEMFIRPITAIMMTVASTAWGRWYKNGVKKRSVAMTTKLVITLDNPLIAPAWRFTALLEKEPETR